MKRRYLLRTAMQMLLAMVLLTACNNDDDNNQAKNTGPGPLAEELSAGTWYNIYEATGVAHAEGAREESMAYSVVADVYHFNTDGTGDFQRCFFGDDDDDILVQGILGYGVFNYSSTADGKVHITLTHQWDQSYPQQWDVSYANEAVNAKGVDGQELKLLLADEGMQAVLNRMAEQNGSSDYDVDAYKPKGIDNSQWMKTLADSRLVADLSLPGSHDACTAEGWQSKLFRFIAEASAKTQELTIREQLKVGMRVFDLRPERVFESTSYGCKTTGASPVATARTMQ
jgi:major membrane immunogen (membrane-anchored lipoprotein)